MIIYDYFQKEINEELEDIKQKTERLTNQNKQLIEENKKLREGDPAIKERDKEIVTLTAKLCKSFRLPETEGFKKWKDLHLESCRGAGFIYSFEPFEIVEYGSCTCKGCKAVFEWYD